MYEPSPTRIIQPKPLRTPASSSSVASAIKTRPIIIKTWAPTTPARLPRIRFKSINEAMTPRATGTSEFA